MSVLAVTPSDRSSGKCKGLNMALDLRAPLGSEHDPGLVGIAGKSSIAPGSHSDQSTLDATDSKQLPDIVPFGED